MKTIAITCRMESFDSQSKWFINATYVDACSQYGCALFPIVSYASLAVAATSCDALIVCGGYDLRSYYLQEIPDASCNFYDHAQDHFAKTKTDFRNMSRNAITCCILWQQAFPKH